MKIKAREIKKAVIINAHHGRINQFSLRGALTSEGSTLIGTVINNMNCDVKIIDESITPLHAKSRYWELVSGADLIGVSAMTHTEDRAYQIIRQVKKINPSVIRIAGGFGPSSNPQKALAHGVNFVVIGEGIETIRELVLAFRNGGEAENINGIAWQEDNSVCFSKPRSLIQNLDKIPFANNNLLVNGKKIVGPVVTTSSGCPYACNFCSVSKFYGKKYRRRSTENGLEYIKLAHSMGKPIFIGDDNFTANPNQTKELLEEIIRLDLKNLSLTTQMRASSCEDKEFMNLAKKDAIEWIFFGYEDISESGLSSINKKQTPEDIALSIQECKKRGIHVGGMFILGLDNHTPESAVQIADFALEHNIDALILFIRTPLPGTVDSDNLISENRILNIPKSFRDLQFVVFKPKNMTARELQESHLDGIKKFYSLKNWRKGAIIRLAGQYYIRKHEKAARRFIQQYLSH